MRAQTLLVLTLSAVGCAFPNVVYDVRGGCSNGRPDGPFDLVLPSGQTQISGSFAHGMKRGLFTIYSSSGAKIAEIPYQDDLLQGTVKLWYMPEYGSNGAGLRKLESSYVSGMRDGPSVSWYSDGTQRGKLNYAKGELTDAQAWDQTGAPLSAEDSQRMASADAEADRRLYSVYEQVIRDNPVRCH